MNSIYEDSQDLIKGQRQCDLETTTLFSTIKPTNGLNMTQVSHIKKLNVYMHKHKLSLHQLANMLEITPGKCLDILEMRYPLTEEMQQAFYKNGGNRFSTNRLNKSADKLKDTRQFKNNEIYERYKYAQKPIKIKNMLCIIPIDGLSTEQAKVFYSIGKFKHPKLGLYLKAFRAKTGDNQYSIPEKLKQFYPESMPICTRDFWHHVETKNYIPGIGNRAFYRLFGLTVQQAIAPFVEAEKYENIECTYNFVEEEPICV